MNGVFYDTGIQAYNSGAQYFLDHGFAAVEMDGMVTLFAVFPQEIADIELSGVSSFGTTTGKMPLAGLENDRHWFGYTGFDGAGGRCQCGAPIF